MRARLEANLAVRLPGRLGLRIQARAAGGIPEHDAVFVSAEPLLTNLLLTTEICCVLRPRVAVPEAPALVREPLDAHCNLLSGRTTDKPELSHNFYSEMCQYFLDHGLGQVQESHPKLQQRSNLCFAQAALLPGHLYESYQGRAVAPAHSLVSLQTLAADFGLACACFA